MNTSWEKIRVSAPAHYDMNAAQKYHDNAQQPGTQLYQRRHHHFTRHLD
jgi:hypothetical protein